MKNLKLFLFLIWQNIKIFCRFVAKSKVVRYMKRDVIDLIMLCLTMMFTALYFIKVPYLSADNFREGNFSAWLAVLCLFIVGSAIWTKGIMTDMMVKYIKDPEIRKLLHLDPEEKTTLEKAFGVFFLICFLLMFVLLFLNLLNI